MNFLRPASRYSRIDLISANVPLLYLIKTENLLFSDVFRVYRRGKWFKKNVEVIA